MQYVTGAKKATELIEGHEMRVSWFEKQGWKVIKDAQGGGFN